MQRFGLVGATLALLASSVSAQQVVNVTTIRECRTKTTIIERIPPGLPGGPQPTLDQLTQLPPRPPHPPCPPKAPPCCLLPDQPALLYRLAVMNALHTSGLGVGGLGNYGALPKLDELPRPGAAVGPDVVPAPKLDELPRPTIYDDKKPLLDDKNIEEKKVVREQPFPATMVTLDATDWDCGRCFTDDCGRRWCLLKGCPLQERLAHVRGWLLESDSKKMYFVHETGNIYARVTVAAP